MSRDLWDGAPTRIRELKDQRDQLLRAIKQHRQATESRLRLLDSRGEAAKSMLKPDRDLYAVLDRVGE